MTLKSAALLSRLGFGWSLKRHKERRAGSIELSVVDSKLLRGPLSATVAMEQFGNGVLFPFLASVMVEPGLRRSVWIYGDNDGTVSIGTIAVTPRHQAVLGITSSAQKIAVEVPKIIAKRIKLPRASDLPQGASLYVSTEIYDNFRRMKGLPAYALMTTNRRIVAAVRLCKRDIGSDRFVASMFLRTVCEIAEGSTIQLSAFLETASSYSQAHLAARVFRVPSAQAWKKNLGAALGLIVITARWMDYAIEAALRLALRSRPMTFRIIQANPGDDDLPDTIRLHPTAFPALAARPGDQVILNWAGRRLTARALEDPSPIDAPAAVSPHILSSVGLHLDTGLLPEGFPVYLVAKVPAPMRLSLGIPPSTIIEIRRRLRPAVVGYLNQLTIPVAGIILAAAAFPAVRGWPLVAGGLAALMFGLAPLRMPRPPRGRWP